MALDEKKLESIASRDEINFKRYRDLNFLFGKITYHINNFEKEFSNELPFFEKEGKRATILQMKATAKQVGIDIGQLHKPEVKISIGLFGEISRPFFYNFDAIMIDAKRTIEFFIKFLVVCMGEKVPKRFSVEKVFLGLKNEVEKPYNFCVSLTNDHKKYAVFLINNWNNWIRKLNDYRTNAIHKSIDNRITGKVKSHWKENSPIESIEIKEIIINYRDTEIKKHVKDLEGNLTKFYKVGGQFIVDNFYNWFWSQI